MIVGSLIKNPGGGLAPIGGYIVGKKECVENAAYRLTSPGLGKEVGASLGVIPVFLSGTVSGTGSYSRCIKGCNFCCKYLRKTGLCRCTEWHRSPSRYYSGSYLRQPGRCDCILQRNSGCSAGGQLCNTGAMGNAGL